MTAPDLDLAALRKAAEAATPGEWIVELTGNLDLRICDGECERILCDMQGSDDAANAAHITAFDPPTCLALLDRLDAAERDLAQLREALRPFAERARDLDDDHSDGEPFTAHAGAFRAAARALGVST